MAGVGDAVRFLGWKSDTERYCQAADVYLSCSSYEAFSLALLEASAAGMPLVVTNVGGAEEMLGGTDAPTGILVGRRPARIGAALAELAADPARRIRYGQAARNQAEHYSWARLATLMHEIYDDLLADVSGRGE
jgi:glycosyltransferase involved in cell wall biosynthesis